MGHDEKITAINVGVGAGGFILYGFTLNEWVAVFTLAYLTLQIGLLVPKYVQMFREWLKK